MNLFDLYDEPQAINTTLPYTSSAFSWGPESERTTVSQNNSSSSIVSGSLILSKTVIATENPNINYTYTIPLIVNGVNFLIARGVPGGNYADLVLRLSDTDETESRSPIGVNTNEALWNFTSQFIDVDKNNIINLTIELVGAANTATNVTIFRIEASAVCITRDTEILLADGNTKLVQDLERGDIVAGDVNRSVCHRVARIPKQILSANSPVDIVTFEPNSLGDNIPTKKLTTTMGHSLLYQGVRKPAYCFVNYPGVTRYKNTHRAKDLMIVEPDDSYIFYDIQFDHIGSFVANGVVLQSRLPWSLLTPLPKELYFDQTLYQSRVGDDDDPGYAYPLNYTILEYKKD